MNKLKNLLVFFNILTEKIELFEIFERKKETIIKLAPNQLADVEFSNTQDKEEL